MTYLRAFVIGAIGMGLLAHFVTTEPIHGRCRRVRDGAIAAGASCVVVAPSTPAPRADENAKRNVTEIRGHPEVTGIDRRKMVGMTGFEPATP